MAEALGVEVVSNIIEKIGSAAFKKILSAKDLDSNIERLRDIESIIAAALPSVDPFETGTYNNVQGPMIARLRRIHEELVYFFDEQAARTKQKEFKSSSKITAKVRSMLPSYKQFPVAEKVNAITTELKDFASDYALTTSIVACSSGNQNRGTSSVEETGPIPDTDVFIGREKDKENIINMLCNSSVVAIVGVGGLGKTTLAQYVCKDDRVRGSFGMPLWVSAAPGSSFKEILEKIIVSATGKKPIYINKEQLQLSVLAAIVGEKRLLVLDNIWYHGNLGSDWLKLRALLKEGGFEGSGSKILITTRQKKAAISMGIPSPYMLRDLAEDDSWTLLQRLALVQEKQLDVEEIGKEIAKMCPKLPLVIKVVGLQLAQKDTIKQWKKFKDECVSTSTLYMQNNNEIMQILKLCYDQLSDENLKSCLDYCSLFPKGHRYSTNYMAHHWIALGFLKPEGGFSLEDVGEECVRTLANLGFFETRDDFRSFEMHDIMHDLILMICNSTHQVINSETEKIIDGVRHVSLVVEDLNWKALSEFRGKRNLESVISVSNRGNHCSIQGSWSSGFDKFISSCPKLKILDVSSRGIEKVPNSISQMGNLGYLNLSENPLKKLPNSITQLVNLLSLDVSFCPNLQELPRGITKLEKLQELKIQGTMAPWNFGTKSGPLSHMPKGIGKLSNLEKLDCFVVVGEDNRISGHNSKASGAANLEELGCLNNLQGQLWIIVDGESKHLVSEAMTTRPLENKTEVNYLLVEFKNSTEEDEMFLEGLRPNGSKLEDMIIINYGGKKLPSWMRDEQFHVNFPELVQIYFVYDYNYQHWYSLGFTERDPNPNKKECILRIRMRNVVGGDGMLEWIPGHSSLKEQSRWGPIDIELSVKGNGLKDLTLYSLEIEKHIAQSLLVGLNLERRSFLNIQRLELREISELEVIPNQIRHLSSLISLRIWRCTNLKAIPDWIDNLTSLMELGISECPKLESLPHQIGNLAESCRLGINRCSQVLVDKCRKPTGEYWPLIQHLCHIYIRLSNDVYVEEGNYITWHDKFYNRKALVSRPSDSVAPTPITSNGSSSHSNTTSVKPYLFFSLSGFCYYVI